MKDYKEQNAALYNEIFKKYSECIINEKVSQYKYKFPKDKKEQLFDFYALVSLPLWGLSSNAHMLRPEHRDADVLLTVAKDAQQTIVKELREQQLKDVLFSLSAEFRHVFMYNSANDILRVAKQHGLEKEMKKYAIAYKLRDTNAKDWLSRLEKIRTEYDANDKRGYLNSYKAIQTSFKGKFPKLVKFMEDSFLDLKWANNYGGKPWASIANAWIKLNNAKKYDDQTVWIDHVFDLQHNTDTVFNKIKEYCRIGGYGWIADALNKKRDARSLFEFWNDMSGDLRYFVARVVKAATGETYESWSKRENVGIDNNQTRQNTTPRINTTPNNSNSTGIKYTLNGEKINVNGKVLHRIVALRNGKYFKKGERGGYISGGHNLSQDGDAWISGYAQVYGSAQVFDNAHVSDDAHVYGNARVYGNAKITDDARVFDNAKVYGKAGVSDFAQVYGDANVYSNARIFNDALVYNKAIIYDDAEVYDNARVYGNAKLTFHAAVYGIAEVFGNTLVYDDARIYENARVYGNAVIYKKAKIYGDVSVYGNAHIYGDAKVYGESEVYGDARVYDKAEVYGDARVYDKAKVYGSAKVYNSVNVYGNAHVKDDIKSSIGENTHDNSTKLNQQFINLYEELSNIIQDSILCEAEISITNLRQLLNTILVNSKNDATKTTLKEMLKVLTKLELGSLPIPPIRKLSNKSIEL